MANPSLQIGNENWAIKEDNLLGYSTAGTRFVPQPITMVRASAGTRVNSSGLVETVGLVVGSEFIDNTNFATDIDWGGSYSINTVTQQLTKTSSGLAYQIDGGIIAGKSYKIVVDVASLDGATTVWVAGNNYNLSLGIQTIYATGGTNSWNGGRIAINNGYASGAGSVLNSISVKEATIDNLARVDYDGSVSSLLVEPQRTNLITYSEDFSNAAWTKHGNTAVASDTVISPDGTQNGDTVTGLDGTGSNDLRNLTGTDPASKTYTGSVYLKGSGTMVIRLSNTIDDSADTQITLTSSWARYTLTHTFNATSGDLLWFFDDASSSTATTYDIWGAQIEEGAYATSYIPTDGSTVTRVQDQYSKTGISDLINSEEGVLFLEIENIVDSAADIVMISLTDGSNANKISIFISTGLLSVESAGSGTNLGIYSKALQSGFNKIAIKYEASNCVLWVNGTDYPDTSFTAFSPSTFNSLAFDRGDGIQDFYGKVKQLQVYKTVLTPSELATLTT